LGESSTWTGHCGDRRGRRSASGTRWRQTDANRRLLRSIDLMVATAATALGEPALLTRIRPMVGCRNEVALARRRAAAGALWRPGAGLYGDRARRAGGLRACLPEFLSRNVVAW